MPASGWEIRDKADLANLEDGGAEMRWDDIGMTCGVPCLAIAIR
jgi:hypothetical protein